MPIGDLPETEIERRYKSTVLESGWRIMTFPFPPLWMKAADGTNVDVSGIYWFVIAGFLFVTMPIWVTALAKTIG